MGVSDKPDISGGVCQKCGRWTFLILWKGKVLPISHDGKLWCDGVDKEIAKV